VQIEDSFGYNVKSVVCGMITERLPRDAAKKYIT
jgi:hypothetical protein